MTIGKALQTIGIRSVPKKVHRRLWTPFATEPIKNGSVPTFLFSFQRVNARPFFGTVLLRFLRARGAPRQLFSVRHMRIRRRNWKVFFDTRKLAYH